MFKYLLFFLTGSLFCQYCQAQKKSDTLLFYVNTSGQLTKYKDGAKFAEFVLPYDRSTKEYPVFMYYLNGKTKLAGTTKTKPGDGVSLVLDGPCTSYYPGGKRAQICFYNKGKIVGDYEEYYPNGKLYCVKSAVKLINPLLIECHDSTGKVLTENGNGLWMELNEARDKVIFEGDVADSLEEGDWHGLIGDTGRFICAYKKGKIISGTGYDASGKAYPFTSTDTRPEFKKGNGSFKTFIWSNIASDAHPRMRGRLYVEFTVERNGKVSHINTQPGYMISDDKTLSDYYNNLCVQVIKAVKLSPPWIPGTIYGIPVPLQVTVPIEFGSVH